MGERAQDWPVDEARPKPGSPLSPIGPPVGQAIRSHALALGRVLMALLGDEAAAEAALEEVVRRAPSGSDAPTLVRLMGLARTVAAIQSSKQPVRRPTTSNEEPPDTVRDRDPTSARALLARLKPTEREAVILHLVGGLDAVEVAEACGVDAETGRSRIARGVAALLTETSGEQER
jgi:RNA polymerase sigma-70 factor, ECF subfamily